jgi:hypothetical protein
MIPVAIFAYNRPKHLQLCLEFFKRAETESQKQFPLFIFCDAPHNLQQSAKTEETQRIAKTVPGATVICREKNYGFKNITEGITELCEQFGQVIIIEDDVLVAPDFLLFMERGLEIYREQSQVFMISGFMYFGAHHPYTHHFFLPSGFIWGWGTWKRAWKHFSWEPKGVKAFLRDRKKCHTFNYFGTLSFSKMLKKTLLGQWNTWDIQWMYIISQKNAVALYPPTSLVWNCGVGGGMHGQDQNQDPFNCVRESYIHGDLSFEEFKKRRICSFLLTKEAFPQKIDVDGSAMRRLAIVFAKERMSKEKRKFKFFYKIIFLKLLIFLNQAYSKISQRIS